MGRKLIGAALALVFLPLTGAATCNTPVPLANIHYEQIGACSGFTKSAALGGGSQTPPSGYVYVVFRIKTISNTDAGAQNFDFDPEKLFLAEDPRQYAIGTFALGWAHPRAVEKRVVKPGSTETFNGTVTVASKQSGGAAAAANIKFTLSYENPSAQAAVLTKDNLSKSAWTYTNDCKDIEKESPNP